MEATARSGFSATSMQSASSNEIVRNRIFANQTSVMQNKPGVGKPLYFVNSSVGYVSSNPNTLRDMGGTRNCEYRFDDEFDRQAHGVSWRELAQNDEELERMQNSKRDTRGFLQTP